LLVSISQVAGNYRHESPGTANILSKEILEPNIAY
jgi:hypothetical protein